MLLFGETRKKWDWASKYYEMDGIYLSS
ncbi:unnamed protein product [Cuscuta epithymum]|uniref:Uncharacterized protein n=1 Tax=Cuscuta epithymum TaxID=186058 RepID=A0AAV0G0V4_9ASTE|nr:unnamed protein product [Cuscuta epithymum]